jgi:hypothetical protein
MLIVWVIMLVIGYVFDQMVRYMAIVAFLAHVHATVSNPPIELLTLTQPRSSLMGIRFFFLKRKGREATHVILARLSVVVLRWYRVGGGFPRVGVHHLTIKCSFGAAALRAHDSRGGLHLELVKPRGHCEFLVRDHLPGTLQRTPSDRFPITAICSLTRPHRHWDHHLCCFQAMYFPWVLLAFGILTGQR